MQYVTELNIPFQPKMAPEVAKTQYDTEQYIEVSSIDNRSAGYSGVFPVIIPNIDKRIHELVKSLGYEIYFAEGYFSIPNQGSIYPHRDAIIGKPDRVKLNFTWGGDETYMDFYKVKDESRVEKKYSAQGRVSGQTPFKIYHYDTPIDNLELDYSYKNTGKWYLARIHEFHSSRNYSPVPRKTMSLILGQEDDSEYGKHWMGWEEAQDVFKDYKA